MKEESRLRSAGTAAIYNKAGACVMDIVKNIIKYVNYPFELKLLHREELLRSYQDLQKKQYRSFQENAAEQRKLLYEIVSYAVAHVPYYRNIAHERNISLTLENIEQDLRKFPVLTKEIIKKEGKRLYSEEKIAYTIGTSGGSTGEPVRLRQDAAAFVNTDKYFLSFAGYDIGDKTLMLWGSEKDVFEGTIGLKAKISNRFIHRLRFLNSFRMDDRQMEEYVKVINTWKPKVIRAYVQSIFELSSYIIRNKKKVYSPAGIVVSAGTLFPEWKKQIEKVFQCPVINQYGSREVSGIAISCPHQTHLHCNMFVNYVEIVDERAENAEPGVDGNIIITNLRNKSMPLLRYAIGDIGALSAEKSCPCGRNTHMLKYVKGRTVNVFRTRDGKRIDGEYFTHLFYGRDWVNRFQVIQNDYEQIDIHVELRQGQNPVNDEMDDICDKIRLVMGACSIRVIYDETLPASPSGKFIYTVCRLKDAGKSGNAGDIENEK